MRTLIGFLATIPFISGQCLKASSPFQLRGANDQYAACIFPNGTIISLDLIEEIPDTAVCTLACDQGYDSFTENSRTIVCAGTDWNTTVDTTNLCPELTCPSFSAPVGSSSPACPDANEGEVCEMTCDSGYVPNQHAHRLCRGGVWTGVELTCTPIRCPTLLPPDDGLGSPCVNSEEGTVCNFTCAASTEVNGDAFRTCEHGKWSGTPLTCTPDQYCPQLYAPDGAYFSVCSHATPGTRCTFRAKPGYIIENAVRLCQDNLTWDGDDAMTTPMDCPPLLAPLNAENSTSCDVSPEGTVCVHQCNNGFVSNNRGRWTCHNGKWLGSHLTCSPRHCPLLSSPDNAYPSSCDDAVEGTLCTFFCRPGFKAVGHGARVCREGSWTGFSFQCVATTERYVWTASGFGSCFDNVTALPCYNGTGGSGVLTRQVACIDTNQVPYTPVSSDLCYAQAGAHDVSTQLACVLEPCPTYQWQFGLWDACSADCGTGYQERSALCLSSRGGSVDDSLCPPVDNVRRQLCNTQPCTGAHWSASEWVPCSGDCYEGVGPNHTRSRYVQCLDEVGNLAPLIQCTNTIPIATQTCNTQSCAAYIWSACPWEACTAQCNGGGTRAGLMAGQRQRNVHCHDSLGRGVSPSLCERAGLPSPVTLLIGCNPDLCTSFNWMTTPWGECVGTGTAGIRTRTYHCHAADGSNVLNDQCPNPPPTTQEACIPNSCPTSAPTLPGSARPTPAGTTLNSGSQLEISVLTIFLVSFAFGF